MREYKSFLADYATVAKNPQMHDTEAYQKVILINGELQKVWDIKMERGLKRWWSKSFCL